MSAAHSVGDVLFVVYGEAGDAQKIRAKLEYRRNTGGNYLEILVVSCNKDQLKEVASALSDNKDIWIGLDIGHRQMETIPPEIYSIPKLDSLKIQSRKLWWLPRGIDDATELTRLWVSAGKLTHIPRDVFYLPQLEELHIRFNQLYSVPVFIRDLVNLQVLDVYGNNIRTIPLCVGRLPRLEILVAGFNRLEPRQRALLPTEGEDCKDLLKFLVMASALEGAVCCGLSDMVATPWSDFLTQEPYDPRLLCRVWEMAFVDPPFKPMVKRRL